MVIKYHLHITLLKGSEVKGVKNPSIYRTQNKIWKIHLKKATFTIYLSNGVAYNIAFQNSFDDILGDVIFEKSLETRISLKINVQFA